MKKTKADLTRGWILKAQSDLADARRTLRSDGPFDTACFHCQQAAEKYLKAFLSFHGKQIPRTHDLEEILPICQKIDHTLVPMKMNPEELTSYAVEMRYDAEFWPDKKVVEDALAQVEEIEKAIRKRLPKELWKED